jgi:RimJ/RimL family protein N-acetyltransferase
LSDSAAAAEGFESARLVLRALAGDDEELYCELFSSADTMRYIGKPWTRAEAAHAFRDALGAMRLEPPQGLFFTMIDKATGAAVGLCTLQGFDWAARQVELGMMLRATGRARGFATEALSAVLAHVFATLPIDEIWVRFAIDHTVAVRTAVGGGLVRSPVPLPPGSAPNLRRWSAYRQSWRPGPRQAADQT